MGTGLGLSLVRAFAELHGGTMTIKSRLGEGTAVSIKLPVLDLEANAARAAPSLSCHRRRWPPRAGDNVIAFRPQR